MELDGKVQRKITNVNATKLAEQSLIENISLDDFCAIDFESTPFDGEAKEIENLKMQDIYLTEVKECSISESPNYEDIGFDDFVQIEKNPQ